MFNIKEKFFMVLTKSGTVYTSDNVKIAYDHYTAGHEQAVIIAHGFFNSKDAALIQRLKDSLVELYDVIIFDFRGHGKSSGVFTWTSKEHYDLESVLDYVKSKYRKVGLIGFSYGAAISIQVGAEKRGIDSLIAISAPSDSSKIDYQFWKLDVENDIVYNLKEGRKGKGVKPGKFWLDKKKPIDCVEKLSCPVLYIHGDKDWVTKSSHSQKLYNKTRSQKKIAIIKNGAHAEYLLRKNKKETFTIIKEWFQQTISPS